MIYMALQGSTQWDALSHAWYGDKLYNGVPQTAIRSGEAGGATKLGIENIKTSFVGRGVLIDVVRYKGGPLPVGYTITRAELEGALKEQKTKVRPGDVVLIRTGLLAQWYQLDRAAKAMFFDKSPGKAQRSHHGMITLSTEQQRPHAFPCLGLSDQMLTCRLHVAQMPVERALLRVDRTSADHVVEQRHDLSAGLERVRA